MLLRRLKSTSMSTSLGREYVVDDNIVRETTETFFHIEESVCPDDIQRFAVVAFIPPQFGVMYGGFPSFALAQNHVEKLSAACNNNYHLLIIPFNTIVTWPPDIKRMIERPETVEDRQKKAKQRFFLQYQKRLATRNLAMKKRWNAKEESKVTDADAQDAAYILGKTHDCIYDEQDATKKREEAMQEQMQQTGYTKEDFQKAESLMSQNASTVVEERVGDDSKQHEPDVEPETEPEIEEEPEIVESKVEPESDGYDDIDLPFVPVPQQNWATICVIDPYRHVEEHDGDVRVKAPEHIEPDSYGLCFMGNFSEMSGASEHAKTLAEQHPVHRFQVKQMFRLFGCVLLPDRETKRFHGSKLLQNLESRKQVKNMAPQRLKCDKIKPRQAATFVRLDPDRPESPEPEEDEYADILERAIPDWDSDTEEAENVAEELN